MFKIGDIVEITEESDATGMLDFTKGWAYRVHETRLSEYGGHSQVFMLNDSGSTGWYHANHFKLKEGAKVEKKECLFKEGQVVYCVAQGKGLVSEVSQNENDDYPVKVKFENGAYDYYATDGRFTTSGARMLFFSLPVVTGATEPLFEPTLKEGDVVVAILNAQTDRKELFEVIDESEVSVIAKTNGYGHVLKKDTYTFYKVGEKIEFN